MGLDIDIEIKHDSCTILKVTIKCTTLFGTMMNFFEVFKSLKHLGSNSIGVQMSSNKPKLMSKHQLLCNSCYIYLYGVTLMACDYGKFYLLNNMDIKKSKINK